MKIRRKYLLVLLTAIGFLVGVLFPDLFWKQIMKNMMVISSEQFQIYLQAEVDYNRLLASVLPERSILMLLLFFASYTNAGIWIGSFILLLLGYSFGLLSAFLVWQVGYFGLVLLLGMTFPQWIFYGASLYYLIAFMERRRMHFAINNEVKLPMNKRRAGIDFIRICGLTLGGCFLEITINPWIIKKILEIYLR